MQRKNPPPVTWYTGAIVLVALIAAPCTGTTAGRELTQKEVLELLRNHKTEPDYIAKTLGERGVDFNLTPAIAEKLQKTGATEPEMFAVWRATPGGRVTPAAVFTSSSGAAMQANLLEAEAYGSIQDELDRATKLRLIQDFESRFPNSPLLSYVYVQAAKTYQASGDEPRALDYAARSLKLDPQNIFALVIEAMVLPEPRLLEQAGAESAAHLDQAQKDAEQALHLISALPQLPSEAPQAYDDRKNALAGDAHFALGMVNMGRGQFDRAADEYRQAVACAPKPEYYYRLGEAYASEGKIAEAITVLAKASQLGRGTVIGQYADQLIAQLKTDKNH